MKWTTHTPPKGFYWAKVSRANDDPDLLEIVRITSDGNVWMIGQANPITPEDRKRKKWVWQFWNSAVELSRSVNESPDAQYIEERINR